MAFSLIAMEAKSWSRPLNTD